MATEDPGAHQVATTPNTKEDLLLRIPHGLSIRTGETNTADRIRTSQNMQVQEAKEEAEEEDEDEKEEEDNRCNSTTKTRCCVQP